MVEIPSTVGLNSKCLSHRPQVVCVCVFVYVLCVCLSMCAERWKGLHRFMLLTNISSYYRNSAIVTEMFSTSTLTLTGIKNKNYMNFVTSGFCID